jgi:hypothetical protein
MAEPHIRPFSCFFNKFVYFIAHPTRAIDLEYRDVLARAYSVSPTRIYRPKTARTAAATARAMTSANRGR